MEMRLGVVGYTNFASGIGLFVYEMWKAIGDSILSVNAGIKGQEVWTKQQLTAGRPPTRDNISSYFEKFKPTHIIFLETPFAEALYPMAKERGIKTVGIPMHETFHTARLKSDLVICPCFEAYRKAKPELNAVLLFLPISTELFPFKERTGHTFVCNIGYGGPHDRRQSVRIVQAFSSLDNPDARLILNCQAQRWPEGTLIHDLRITYHLGSYPMPADAYEEGDIAIFPMAYGGYERPILESMARGMPCVTMDADPMNLFQHDPDFLLEPERRIMIRQSQWVENTHYNQVSVDDLKAKMEWLLTIDTREYSHRARKQAEAQSWESSSIDYKNIWLEAMGSA
jgi:hypothetical protein